MEAPFETEFLIRRIGQLWTQAADLPERSAAQAQIEELACKLSDYVSGLYQKQPRAETRRRRKSVFVNERPILTP